MSDRFQLDVVVTRRWAIRGVGPALFVRTGITPKRAAELAAGAQTTDFEQESIWNWLAWELGLLLQPPVPGDDIEVQVVKDDGGFTLRNGWGSD